MKKKNCKPKEDKAKHGLMIRTKISFFFFFFALECEGFPVGRRRKREEKKEKRRREEEEIQVWNSCLEHLFCLEPMYGFVG